jgi:sarcosine oxidase
MPEAGGKWNVIVVGAGAVGSAALRAASDAGARVLGIEQFAPAHARGSSHGHSRIFRHAYFEHPDYVPLLRHSTARFESLERESGAALLHRCGMLVAGRDDSAVVRGTLAAAQQWALPLESLDARALQARFPLFSLAENAIGAFEIDAGIVRPEATVHASVRIALTRGAELRTTSRVRSIVEDATGVSVATDQGRERADAVIIAAGAWTSRLIPELAPLLEATRQVQAWIAPTEGVDASPMPCWLFDRGPGQPAIYGLAPDPAAPEGANGSPSPSRYPKVAFHGSTVVVDPDLGAAPIAGADVDRLLETYRSIAPGLAGAPVTATTCLYTMSPDGHFLVGTRRGLRRTHFAAGLSGHGFKLAPALGDALVDLALQGRTELPIGFLSATRFVH